MIEEYFRLIFRNLKRRGLRSWLTMLGIFIGIAAVVSLIALGDGLREGVVGQFANIGSDRITIQALGAGFGPPGSTAAQRLTLSDLEAVRDVSGLSVVSNRMLRSAPIEYNDQLRFGFMASMPEEADERRLITETMDLKTSEGRLLRSSDLNKIVVGISYVESDFFGRDVNVGTKLIVNGKEMQIVGVLTRMSNPQFNDLILMNEEVMRDLLNLEDEVDLIVAQVADVNEMEVVRDRIERTLRRERGVEEGKEDFGVSTPEQLLETFNTILNLVQWIIIGIASISLVVGGVGIANTMFTSVLERRREIGIMKAIGARNNTILSLFVIESGILGVVGGLIGIVLGVAFALSVQEIGKRLFGEGLLTASFNPFVLVGVVIFSFLVGIIFGVIPARQASLIPPVEALRK